MSTVCVGCVISDPSYLGPASSDTTAEPPATDSSDSLPPMTMTMSSATSTTSATGDGSSGPETTATTMTSASSSETGDVIPDEVLLWTTLDDADSVLTPEAGDGTDVTFVTMPASDFVSTPRGGGIVIDETGEYVRYRQVAEAANIEFDRGTIEFWYQPNYDSGDGQRYRIVATDGSMSGLRIRKNLNNRFAAVLYDQTGMEHITSVAPGDFQWSAGQWVHIRVTWETMGAPETQAVRIYFDGVEASQYNEIVGADIVMGEEQPGGWIYIGAISRDSSSVADGVLDEFIVYDEPLPP